MGVCVEDSDAAGEADAETVGVPEAVVEGLALGLADRV